MSTHTFDTGEVTLAYDDTGGTNPPLVLLHGLSSRRGALAHFATPLQDEWRVISVDLRGHGDSGKVPGRYELSDYGSDIAALLSGLLDEPAVLVGHSLGAFTALAATARQPERVRALIMFDPPMFARNRTIEARKAFKDWYGWVIAVLQKTSDAAVIAAAYREAVPSASAAEVANVSENLAHLDPGTVMLALEGRLTTEQEIAAALDAVRCPALLVRGDWAHDAAMDDDDAAWVKTHLPQVTDVKFPDGTHLFPQERADETLRHLVAFLETVRAGGGDAGRAEG